MSGRKLSLIFLIFLTTLSLIFIITKNNQRQTITINNKQILIEAADTDEKRNRGLSERENLPENSGMLFIFPRVNYYQFWMYKMNFPLDFVFIKDDSVVDTSENVSPPQNAETPKPFTARYSFNRVLEINAGKVKEWNIKTGDKIWYNF